MSIKKYKNVDGIASLLVQMSKSESHDFKCLLYDDGIAKVGIGGLRVLRIQDDVKSKHPVLKSDNLYSAYLFNDSVLKRKYVSLVSGMSEVPVKASEAEISDIEDDYWLQRCELLQRALTSFTKSPKFEVEDPMTGHAWEVWDLAAAEVMPGDILPGRIPHLARCIETGDMLAFDTLDDGTAEIAVYPGQDDDALSTIYGALPE